MVLRNQKTSIQLLVPSYCTDLNGHKGMIVSNDGAQCFFSVFGFPIHGKYDDYGDLRDIERDKNVEMIEDFFNLDINTIIQNVGDDRWKKYGENNNDKYWKIPTKDGGAIKNPDIFLSMAMTYIRTEVLEHMQNKVQSRYADRTINALKEKEETLKNIQKLIPDVNLNDKDEYKPALFNLAKKYSKMIEEKLDENGNKLSKKRIEGLENASSIILKYAVGHGDDILAYSSYIPSLTERNMFKLLPITSEFEEEIRKQFSMLTFMSAIRRTLIPSDYGSQDDNYNMLIELNNLSNDLMKKDFFEEMEYEYIHYYEPNKESFIEDYGERAKQYLKHLEEQEKE
jgi:hypothetical protein